jgi:DNA-binding NtrC family response regulator
VVFDCAAVPWALIESQLFGHERGAFTGADRSRTGVMEEADGGTLVLDELGELPLEVQPKLLRALETREVAPLGSSAVEKVDVRVIACTNRDLAAEVNRGAFRDDLYHRVAVVRVELPPLRERPEDVRPLVERFFTLALGGVPERARALVAGVRSDDWRALERHTWPGNARELRNVVDRALALGEPALARALDPSGRSSPAVAPESSEKPDLERPFLEQKAEIVAAFEQSYLLGMLERHGGNQSRAAAGAGIDRMYFKRILKKYRE